MDTKDYIDISPVLHKGIAVFPGDVPFTQQVSMSIADGDHIGLSSISTTLHVGAHADAPIHYHKGGEGIDLLRDHLKKCMGYGGNVEGRFSARRRHLHALHEASQYLDAGHQQLTQAGAGELLAEDLRQCQNSLGEITGKISSDDLLGKIFSSFCIGK